MIWEELVVYPTSECAKSCPFCPIPVDLKDERELDFFEAILEVSQAIPRWTFVWGKLSPARQTEILRLIQTAWRLEHAYAITTVRESLRSLPLEVFQRARALILCWDEYKIAGSDWEPFFRDLLWAQQYDLAVEVQIDVTEFMLEKLLETPVLERLLASARKIHFHVPKADNFPFMHRDRFGSLLDLLVRKMKTLRVSRKIELDPCLLPILHLEHGQANPPCAWHGTLSIFPDGSLKRCPFDKPLARIRLPRTLASFLKSEIHQEVFHPPHHCPWRDIWKVQESAPEYPA